MTDSWLIVTAGEASLRNQIVSVRNITLRPRDGLRLFTTLWLGGAPHNQTRFANFWRSS